MEHQDWNSITFNTVSNNKKMEEKKKLMSNKINNNHDNVTHEPSKQLGQIISKARTSKNKTQKELAQSLGISSQLLGRWENNKEIPTNLQLATIEKQLGVKIPRNKKVLVKDI